MTVDDLIVGFRRKGSSQDENSTDARSLYVPFYPSWQQPRNKQKGVRVEFLVVIAVVGLVLTIVAVSTVYNWSRKRCCKAKSRDFNFSMSMYDDDSDAGVVLRQSLESEDDDKEVVSTLLTPKTSLPDYTSAVQPDDGKKIAMVYIKDSPQHLRKKKKKFWVVHACLYYLFVCFKFQFLASMQLREKILCFFEGGWMGVH